MKWKQGFLYVALHNVGDDPLKSMIENNIVEEFKNEPEILDRITNSFKEAFVEWFGDTETEEIFR
jgi:hypothetical protein